MKALARLVFLAAAVVLVSSLALSQSLTTGAINGTIVDSTGAAIRGATIVATNTKTGAQRTTTSGDTGTFVLAQLDPGDYALTAQAQGFKTAQSGAVTVSVSRVASFHFRLQVGTVSEKVEVTTQAPLIEPSNPNTTTTFSATQLADLPNPGMDLSYVAGLAPGALLNVVSSQNLSSGTFEVSGLPSVSNDFTIDGLDANEPVQNLNSTGSSGLQLGLNAMQEVTVNTQSYSVDQGRFGGAVVNYVTKSGSNAYHGNAYEVWNGSALNATNFFIKADPTHPAKPRTNTNLFGASIGGPIKKDKLFFFADFEGARLIVASILTSVLPTPAYQNFVLQQLPLGGTDSFGNVLPPQPEEVALYQRMFGLMGDTSQGTPFGPIIGCPFDVGGGAPAITGEGDGCANLRLFSSSPVNSENLFTLKLDYHGTPKDSYWFRFQLNDGTSRRPDAVNALFDTAAPAQLRSGSAGWTHVFRSNLVNQFNPGLSYSSAIHNVQDRSKALAAMPITYGLPTPFSTVGGSLTITPLGSATTTWQLNDNLAWIHGRHNFTFGANIRRLLLTDFHNFAVVPSVGTCDLEEFAFGAACFSTQAFPKDAEDRITSVNMDLYANDTVHATSRLTLTFGLRAAWNSNPVSKHHAFSRFVNSFENISHDVNRPPSEDILSGQEHLYPSLPLIQWQPRVAVAYEINKHTLLAAGGGLFGDPLGLLSGIDQAENPPAKAIFNGGLFGSAGGVAVFPGVPNNVVDAAIAANQQFQSAFSSGALSCASPQASGNCVPVLSFLGGDYSGVRHYPYIIQWSSSLQHQIGKDVGITLRYVGTRTVRTLYVSQPNLFQTACQGCFAPIPFGAAPDSRFSGVNSFHDGANSAYHALVVSGEKRMSHGLDLRINYTYSHCIDVTSNGGQLGFSDNFATGAVPPSGVGGLRGNCDYDIRHSVNANYVYELPFNSKRPLVRQIVNGWQLAGTVFARGGMPFSVSSATDFIDFSGAGGVFPLLFANPVPGQSPYSRSIAPGTPPGTIQWLNPNAFQSVVDPNTFSCVAADPKLCQSGSLGRNTLQGPGFTWADLTITKRFPIKEGVHLRVDTQLFNLFNHPNFSIPSFLQAGNPGFGAISSSVSPITGLLGSGLGGDTSIRMIAFGLRVEF